MILSTMRKNNQTFVLACLTCVSPVLQVSCSMQHDNKDSQSPNIVIILADDMGYGDISALNPGSRIRTPAIDNLVKNGIVFTNAHASASVCTPSRYGILTGRYAQRSTTGADRGIMGFHASVIEPGRTTIASQLKHAGYSTACIGKWHLGLDWQTMDGSPDVLVDHETARSNVNYALEVTRGPNNYGFDYSFIHPASLDIPPYMFLRNHQVIDPDVILTTDHYPIRRENTAYAWDKIHTDEHAVYWEKGVWWRQGEMSRSFRIETCQSEIVREGVQFIENHMTNNTEVPFLLYLPLTGPHTPWVPTEKFKGKSPIGLYGDFVMEIDYVVKQIRETLLKHGIADNTILIFASDNGGYWPQEEIDLHDHDSNWGRRGQKGDLWDGGHRVPLIISWPARIKNPFTFDKLVSLTDLFATFSEIAGLHMTDTMGEDSFSLLHVINGEKEKTVRPGMTHYSSRAMYGVRDHEWKYISGLGSGGFTHPSVLTPQPGGPAGQLYRIVTDSLESENVYQIYPEIAIRMQEILTRSKKIPDRLSHGE